MNRFDVVIASVFGISGVLLAGALLRVLIRPLLSREAKADAHENPSKTAPTLAARLVDQIFTWLLRWLTVAVLIFVVLLVVWRCTQSAFDIMTFRVLPPTECNQCILQSMPGATNDLVVDAVIAKCYKLPLATRPLLRPSLMSSPEDCAIAYGNQPSNENAIDHIRMACRALFGAQKEN